MLKIAREVSWRTPGINTKGELKFLGHGQSRGNASAGVDPTQRPARTEVNQKMRAVCREVDHRTLPETWCDPPHPAYSQRHEDGRYQTVRKLMVQTGVSEQSEAYGKVEIRQIGKQYRHSKTRKILAPLRGQPNLQLLRKDEESPESSNAVCDWRSHRGEC